MNAVGVVLPWRARCGEGPVWDARQHVVHWVDIPLAQIHTSSLSAATTSTVNAPTTSVGAVAPRRRGGLVAAVAEGFAHIGARGAFEICAPVLGDGHRMNDAKCDPVGRFWAGSTSLDFTPGHGGLWVLDAAWRVTQVLEGLTLPNGMGWSPDGRTYYLADTLEREISAFDFDATSSALRGRRVLARIDDEHEGMPDGLCVDTDGCLWVAMWGGACLIKFAPDGERLATIQLPVAQPSACAFVGPDLSQLWVTSARDGLSLGDDERPDGSIFRVDDPQATGLPVAAFAG